MRLFASPRFAEHVTPPGHPERLERATVFDEVTDGFRAGGGLVEVPRPVTSDELARVHTPEYLDLIAKTEGRAVMLDPDTFTSPESSEIAALAAGAAVEAALYAWRTGEAAMAMVRPPGHHAAPGRAMGFCLYNNIAIAAASLREAGAPRVAIVDFDVHHGNGTERAFYTDPTVLFISSHQYPYYPGTGAFDDIGAGEGRGFTLNLPMAAGARDAEYLALYETIVLPALTAFRPAVVLVSAGYDAHELDPLAGMRMTTDGFAALVRMLKSGAASLCDGRIAFVTEGGYHLGALRACLEATLE